MRWFLLSSILLSVACAPRTEYSFAFDGDTDDRAEFEAAIAEWNTCGVLLITIADSGMRVRPVVGFFEDANIAGYTSDEDIRYKLSALRKREVFAHELGHVFGLEHSDLGLMHALRKPDDVEHFVGGNECAALWHR